MIKLMEFSRPKGLGHACNAIMQCVATSLMLALKDVIDRCFDQVTGRAAVLSITIFARYSLIDW
jgi:hypothetical protein